MLLNFQPIAAKDAEHSAEKRLAGSARGYGNSASGLLQLDKRPQCPLLAKSGHVRVFV